MPKADGFRRIALGMPDSVEGAHMGHPDFRTGGRIFATLHPDLEWAMVKLTPEQQPAFVRGNPSVFVPEKGAWGRAGCTAVRLDAVDEEILGAALTLAWEKTAKKGDAPRSKRSDRPVGAARLADVNAAETNPKTRRHEAAEFRKWDWPLSNRAGSS